MITKITSIEELQKLFTKVLLSKTDKVTKVSSESVLGGISYGVSKIGQKALKDIALVETNLFPESAYGENLDIVADRRGVPPRLGASESSVYLRIVADPGTQYQQGVHIFSGQGVNFQIIEDTIIGSEGYTYIRARSLQQGVRSNVNSLLIDTVLSQPPGHISVVNEFRAQGGRDVESDDVFRDRIINYPNIMSKDTLSSLRQLMLKFESDVFRVYKKGVESSGRIVLGIMLQSGSFLSQSELDTLLQNITPFLSLSDIGPNGEALLVLENCGYLPIDIQFRFKPSSSVNLTQLRIDIQNKISKYLDLRFWDSRVVQWEYLLNIVSSHKDVILLPEKYFSPGSDIAVYLGNYPRVRSFKMYNLDGELISENSNNYEPVLYTDNVRYIG